MFRESRFVGSKQVFEDELGSFGRVKLLELFPCLVFCDVSAMAESSMSSTHEWLVFRPFCMISVCKMCMDRVNVEMEKLGNGKQWSGRCIDVTEVIISVRDNRPDRFRINVSILN